LTSLSDFEIAVAEGWKCVGTYPDEKRPSTLQARYTTKGVDTAEMSFDQNNVLVPIGQYALWIKNRER
jgi:hypothetical protein